MRVGGMSADKKFLHVFWLIASEWNRNDYSSKTQGALAQRTMEQPQHKEALGSPAEP